MILSPNKELHKMYFYERAHPNQQKQGHNNKVQTLRNLLGI